MLRGIDSYLVVDAAREAREVLSRVDNDLEPMAVVAANGTSGAMHCKLYARHLGETTGSRPRYVRSSVLQVLTGAHRELDCLLRRKLTGANSSGHASRPPPSFS